MSFLKQALLVRKTLIIIIVPLAALPILFIDGSKEMACLYGVIITGSMWITEALPIPVTALFPVVLFPILGVLPSQKAASSYIKDTMFFSFACLSFALCIERWNLHRRIALSCLLLTGSSPKWLLLGFMAPTWFLSMWVNNTSATAMMVPVASAVLKQLEELQAGHELAPLTERPEKDKKIEPSPQHKSHIGSVESSQNDIEADHDVISSPASKKFRSLCKALSLGVCYSATIGGTGSLTGTTTNLVIQGQADEFFAQYELESGVTFLTWIMCCLPLSFICLFIAWVWLVVHFFGFRQLLQFTCGDERATQATRSVVRQELNKLGPCTFAEKAVVGHFLVMLTLWLTMKMPGGFGWAKNFQSGYVTNSTSGIILLSSLFVFPSGTRKKPSGAPEPLLNWQYVQDHLPWGTWILLGGGFSIASSCQSSGLSAWVGSHLTAVSSLQPWLMLFVLSLCMSFMTEMTSNTATATILGPIMAQLAVSLQVNPLYLLYATALSCSLAFMLPVATAPNAIVFATDYIHIKDMVKAGVVLNFLCVLVICVFINTWFTFLLDLDVLPPEMTLGLGAYNTTESYNGSSVNSTVTPWRPTENGTASFI
ncbi:hypothetical protein RRG08_047354 [Elysia crispata]|uniref:Uncharacterized protein n=1 Tax=Elysia crispata TaxID=231223 RepID=A0AAE1E751_9GAST|nr:hypothetical protein RRG08_047354 [Elysia crispata]